MATSHTVHASPRAGNPPEHPGFVVCPDADAGPDGLWCQAFDAATRLRCDRTLTPHRDERGRLWTPDDMVGLAYASGLLLPPLVLCRTHLAVLRGWRDRNPSAPVPAAEVER